MAVLVVMAIVCLGAALLWLFAAFVLRAGSGARWLIVTLVPLVGIWVVFMFHYAPDPFAGPDLAETRGGFLVMAIFSFLFAGFATMPAIVTAFIMETKLGWRAQ